MSEAIFLDVGFFRPSVLGGFFFSAEEQSVDVGLVRPETRTQGFSLDFLIFGSFGVKNMANNKMSTQNNQTFQTSDKKTEPV